MDLDGDADFDDIRDFVLALNFPDAYEALRGVPPSFSGDTDEDGDFDFDDIAGFVAILNTPLTSEAQVIPEPTTIYLACVGLLGIAWLRSWRGHTCQKRREALRR